MRTSDQENVLEEDNCREGEGKGFFKILIVKGLLVVIN